MSMEPAAALADNETAPAASNGVKGDVSGIEFRIDLTDMIIEGTFKRGIGGIFRKSWLPVCHAYHVPNPSDYHTRHLPGLNANIFIVRGRDNVVRAFHNGGQIFTSASK